MKLNNSKLIIHNLTLLLIFSLFLNLSLVISCDTTDPASNKRITPEFEDAMYYCIVPNNIARKYEKGSNGKVTLQENMKKEAMAKWHCKKIWKRRQWQSDIARKYEKGSNGEVTLLEFRSF